MYAVIQIGASQYKVSEGDLIEVDRMKAEKGKAFTIDKVMLFADGAKIQVGKPFLDNVKVKAKLEEHNLGKKVVAFKYRRRKNSSVKTGSRQKLTLLNVQKIEAK